MVSLVAVGGPAQAGSDEGALAKEMASFQQRVMPEATGAPTAALARRYLKGVDPEVRQRIGDQVRQEQRADATASGHDALVLRRLELYEAALQQTGTVTAARAR